MRRNSDRDACRPAFRRARRARGHGGQRIGRPRHPGHGRPGSRRPALPADCRADDGDRRDRPGRAGRDRALGDRPLSRLRRRGPLRAPARGGRDRRRPVCVAFATPTEENAMGDRLNGKVCIVTGAGSGIGKATAIRFAEEGARVTCVDVNADAVAATAKEIGANVFGVAADVSDPAQVRDYTDQTAERWGRLDVVFNNAGVNLPGVFHEASDEVIDRTLAVNVRGPMYGCRYAIPHMLRGGGGSLINTSSVNGLVAEPFLTIYSASKGAAIMLPKW